MRKLFLTICFSMLIINCFADFAKWTKQENWRKITDNMPESEVIKLIGKPSYEKMSMNEKVLYYSRKEPFVSKYGIAMEFTKIDYNEDASIILKREVLKDSTFYVSSTREPNFYKIKDIQEAMPKKLKPIECLESWQKEKTWKRIKYRMKEKTLVALLGEPTIKKDKGGAGRRYAYYYGELPLWGVVNINALENGEDNYVESWGEPFWYLLNKELYEEVKSPAKNEPLMTLEIQEMPKVTFLRFVEKNTGLTEADKKAIRKDINPNVYTHARLTKYQQNGYIFLMIDQYYPRKIIGKDSAGHPIVTGGSGSISIYKLENEIWRLVKNTFYD
ncbi:MAG: hypothetical protein ABFS32_18010 [Bacteroidota bacterium]